MDLQAHKPRSSQAKDSADLSYSQLAEVPSDLFRLHHLRTLRLDNNSLSQVPWTSLMALESLVHVNLSYNRLHELPEALAKWNTLEMLDVSHNRIGAFSQALRPLLLRAYFVIPLVPYTPLVRPDPNDYVIECPHLTRALIKQFGDQLPATFRASFPDPCTFPRKQFAQVTANPRIEIMDYVSSSPHIFWEPQWAGKSTSWRRDVRPGKAYWKLVPGAAPRVKLDGNPVLETMPRLETDPTGLAAEWDAASASGKDNATDSADFSHSHLLAMPTDVTRMHYLCTLRLDNNLLTNVPWAALMALESLTHVNLSHNRLSELPEALAKWNTLEMLDVSHNRIGAFSRALWPLLLQPFYIIPMQAWRSGRPDPNEPAIECPYLTRALVQRYGDEIPASFRMTYPKAQHSSRFDHVTDTEPAIEFTDYAAPPPLIRWQPEWSTHELYHRHEVRPGKSYWRYLAGDSRVLLDGNPVLETMPRLATHPADVAGEWHTQPATRWLPREPANPRPKPASASRKSDNSSDSDDSDDSDDEAKGERKKDARENTRKVRREQRHKTKGNANARDAKLGAP